MSDNMTKDDDQMTPEERMTWLRERGVQVETPEERNSNRSEQQQQTINSENMEMIDYVHIPHDTSRPLTQHSFAIDKTRVGGGDCLSQHLKPHFAQTNNNSGIDMSLFQQQSHLSSSQVANVSPQALEAVASQGSVETFPLVHATPSNNFVGINIYLDEVGMLKRLPLNTRASEYATRAGFDPPPQFYGDVFLGRIKTRPVLRNVSFQLGADTAMDAEWLVKAMDQNLEFQASTGQTTGTVQQPSLQGEDGVAKQEEGFEWTQTDEEVELVMELPGATTTREIKVKFLPKSVHVSVQGTQRLLVNLFDRVDVDGCTWTLDKKKKTMTMLVITLEKSNATGWPRLTH